MIIKSCICDRYSSLTPLREENVGYFRIKRLNNGMNSPKNVAVRRKMSGGHNGRQSVLQKFALRPQTVPRLMYTRR